MIPIHSPKELLEFAERNAKRINGFLLSGGSTLEGRVPLEKYVEAVRYIIENYGLRVNVHTGLIDERDLQYLRRMKPSHISFDVVGSDDTIHEVFGLRKGVRDYFHALELFDSSGLEYSPHLIIGLHFGELRGEKKVIDFIATLHNFSNLVLIVLIPTKGTPMENVTVREEDVVEVARYASEKIDSARITLGCMRPRNMHKLEKLAVDLNFRGIVLPSLHTLKYARENGVPMVRKEMCCVF